MKKSLLAVTAAVSMACGVTCATEPAKDAWPIRAVQLDLARQMETIPMIKGYCDLAAKAGYNTIVLYLEARVQTKTFALPKGEGYSPAEMKEVVDYAAKLGLDIVPVVSPLGHGEKFFRYRDKERDALSEERGGDQRFFVPSGAKPELRTFCWSKEGTRKFFAKYFAELCEIFPSKYFHAGMDESFNTGFCPLCREKVSGGRLGEHFMEVLKFTHDELAKHGKRMWMWDDFFEFFPEQLVNVPKDVIMCNWMYAPFITPHGGRGHYTNQIRRDYIKDYAALGLETIAATEVSGYDNNVSFNDYARKRKGVIGVLACHWELERVFTSLYTPYMVAEGKIMNSPNGCIGRDCMSEAVDDLFPSLDAICRSAVRELAVVAPNFGGGITSLDQALANPEPDNRYAGIQLAVDTIRKAYPKLGQGEVAADSLSEMSRLEDLVLTAETGLIGWRLKRVARYLVRPDRTAKDVAQAKAKVEAERAGLERILVRREAQVKVWRKNCDPSRNTGAAKGMLKFLDEVKAVEDGVADNSEWLLELDLSLPDFYGTPWWTVSARFDGEWKTIAANWCTKPYSRDWAHYSDFRRFRMVGKPDAVRVSYRGYGEGGLDYIALESKAGRWVPQAIHHCEGLVRNCQNALKDNWDAAWFGFSDRLIQILDPRSVETPAMIEFTLVREK